MNPVALSFGFIQIRWYAVAYIVGIIAGILYAFYLEKNLNLFNNNKSIKKKFFEDLVFYAVLGILIGGRFGYIFFYNLGYYIHNPLHIFYIWQGGMSFHGGLIGTVLAIFVLSKKYKISFLNLIDLLAPVTTIGLFLGRIANFINQELIGRPSSVAWSVIYNNDSISRHPSELYEALLEGLLLFTLLLILWKKFRFYKNKGYISSIAIMLYALFRIFAELFREPDQQVGFILGFLTMGQILSAIMFIIGVWLFLYARKFKR